MQGLCQKKARTVVGRSTIEQVVYCLDSSAESQAARAQELIRQGRGHEAVYNEGYRMGLLEAKRTLQRVIEEPTMQKVAHCKRRSAGLTTIAIEAELSTNKSTQANSNTRQAC